MEVDSNIDMGDMNLPDDLVACSSKSSNEVSTTVTNESNKETIQVLNGLIAKTTTTAAATRPSITPTGVAAASGVSIPQKIAPKPSSHKAITVNHKAGGVGQIVLIQGPGGTTIPIKLIGSNALPAANAIKTTTEGATSISIQQLQSKMASIMNQQKKIVPAKSTAQSPSAQSTANQFTMKSGGLIKPQTVQLTTTNNHSSPSLTPKVVVTTATGKVITSNNNAVNRHQQTSVTAPRITPPMSTSVSNALTTTGKVMSPNEVKIMDFIRRQKMLKNQIITSPVKQNLPQLQPKVNTTIVGSSLQQKLPVKPINSQTLNQQPKMNATQNQSVAASTSKPVIKLSAAKPQVITGQPQLQTINIPGKNVQYVRLLNPLPNTTIAIRTANGQQKILPAPPPGKVIIQKPGQHISIVNNNPTPASLPPRRILNTELATAQSDYKVGERKMIAVFKKGDIKSGTLPEGGKVATLTTSQLSKLKGAKIISTGENSKTNIVMLPADYMKQLEQIKSKQPTITTTTAPTMSLNTAPTPPVTVENVMKKFFQIAPVSPSDDPLRKRNCNCTKSQCLKLYCDCFANGEFCGGCNCKDCFNTLANESDRNEAIQLCLERNPNAFKPKVSKGKAEDDQHVRHSKGCNCKKSNCLKNYCECYEAKVACSANCKCVGCRNDVDGGNLPPPPGTLFNSEGVLVSATTSSQIVTVSMRKPSTQVAGQKRPGSPISSQIPNKISAVATTTTAVPAILSKPQPTQATSTITSSAVSLPGTSSARPSIHAVPQSTSVGPTKQPYNFMTQDVIEATVQCMIAQADDCQKRRVSAKYAEKMILEEFGRCLVEIIEFSSKNEN